MAFSEPLNFSYSEVATYLMNTPLKEEISLDIGDNQSTLQDFKSSESAGYYCYKESNVWSSPCSNRFIYWRSNNDCVEFLEVSLDSNLVGNHIKIKFRNTAILDGISVHESGDKVIILLASVASIHRIALPHPKKLGCVVIDRSRANKSIVPHEPICLNADELLTRKSIFYDVTAETLRDLGTYHVLNSSFNVNSSYSSQDMPFPVRSCSWLNHRNEACFALADYAGVISILTMVSPREGKVTRKDLKNTSIIKSIFYNLVPSVLSRTAQESEQAALHVLSHRNPLSFDDDLIIALCRDLRIRVWSYSDQECILTRSVMDIYQQSATSSNTSHTKSIKPTLLSPPVMKKVDQPFSEDGLRMVVYLATQFGRRFILYNLGVSDESLELSVYGSVVAPADDLFDFVSTPSTIWALWQTQNDISLTHWELEKKSQYWQNVTLYNEFQPITSVIIPNCGNCRAHFIDHIFRKGRFSMQTIIKTISTLSRTHESSYSKLSLEKLIIEAVKIVTNKIRQRSASSEMAPEIYNTFESELWREFDSYCVQYHQVFNKPLSLMIDSRTGLAGILRVSSISFIRPNDALDHVLLSLHHPVNYIISNTLFDDPSLEGSTQVLLRGTKMIDNHLPQEAGKEFECGVISGEPLDQIAENVIDNHIMINPELWEKPGVGMVSLLERIVYEAPKLFEAIQVILNRFSLDRSDISEDEVDGLVPPGNAIDQFLVGTVGNCILAESMKQMCRLRYNFLRNLLIFQLLVLRSSQKRKIALNKAIELRNSSIQRNIHHLQSYYSMLWLSEKCMALKQNSSLGIEKTLSLLATLELNDYINLNRGGPLNLPFISDFSPKSVLAYIINHKKCISVRKNLVQRLNNMEDLANCHNWLSILPSLLHLIAEVIWPNSHSPHLMQFMLGYEQFDNLDEYARLLDGWSSFNSHSRQFIHGLTRCFSNKPKTSLPFFYSALAGIRSEPFLQKIFMPNPPKDILEKPSNQFSNTEVNNFFNKLIRLCRLNVLTSVIIDLATEAIQYLDPTEESYNIHYSAFLTTLFMCHLENGDTSNAFQVMILNPSPIQRKDCLRQFTARLYEDQAIEEMISYTYGDMTDDFVSILEFRARSRDLLQTEKKVDFYEILYAYFSKENNYRKAAAITYEYAKRLGQEVNGIASLKKQAECLLLTINSLKLVDPEYAWIIRPVPKPIASSMSYSLPVRNGSATKRKHSSDEEDPERQANDTWVRTELQDLGIHEIRCEYVLINARHRLLESSPTLNAVAATPLTAEETVTLLIANLLFDLAFQLSSHYNLPYEPILEGLVGKYVYLTELPNLKINQEAGLREINECFIDNDTAALSFIARSEMLPIDKLLFLILAYVEKYEKPKQSQLHRCVAEKLLSSGIPLPAPLKLSYQKRNPPELLYLLMSYDYIEHAVTFAMEYTDGYLGKGSEFFNIEVPRVGEKSIVYYPHQHIKCLLKILETESADHKEYEELSNQLQLKYQEYYKLIKTCTLARPC